MPLYYCTTLLRDQRPSGFRVEVIEKIVAAGRKRPDPNYAFAVSRDYLLNSERHALELHRRCVEVLDLQDDWPVGAGVDLSGLEAMVLD